MDNFNCQHQGYWVIIEDGYQSHVMCSICGSDFIDLKDLIYCPKCGAVMEHGRN